MTTRYKGADRSGVAIGCENGTCLAGLPFPCDECGECCRHIDQVSALHDFDDGRGCCIHLRDNRCDIYASRPLVCRGEYIYRQYYPGASVPEFYNEMIAICATLKGGMV